MLNLTYLFGGFPRLTIPNELTSEAELLKHLGMNPAELKRVWWFRGRMYHSFDISKASGGKRTISAPDKRLKMLQRKIATLLGEVYKPRNAVHGFVLERSVKTNALCHVNRKFIINLDLKDFFPSITEARVSGLFMSLGVDSRVSEIITRICCLSGSLPQGSPASPTISNMICFRMDKALQDFAKNNKSIYTRYADDLTFSFHQPPVAFFESTLPVAGRFSPDALKKSFLEAFSDNGFDLNPDKCHYADRNSRRIVTGIKVNEFLNIERTYYRNIRAIFYHIEKHGVPATEANLLGKHGNGAKLANHLHGKIEWLGFIKGKSDPIFRRLATKYNAVFPPGGFALAPTPHEVRDRAIWVIEDGDGTKAQGTAFFLKGVGLVTAAHCIVEGEPFKVFHPSKTANRFDVGVQRLCKHRDLAILKHDIPVNEYYELEVGTGTLSLGDDVFSMGFPSFGPGDKLNVRRGTVSSLPVKRAVPLVEVTQKHAQGMSGGPVTDADGSVYGVIHKGGPAEPRDFAVHVDALIKFAGE